MGQALLKKLDSGAELWTGDSFEYLYVKDDVKHHHIPPEVLYEQLTEELRRKLITAAESAVSWVRLAACLQILEPGEHETQ